MIIYRYSDTFPKPYVKLESSSNARNVFSFNLRSSISVLGNGLEDNFYVAQVLYLTTFRLENKSILDTLFNCYKTVLDIRIFRTASKSSFWIIIHLRITQKVKMHANLDRKFKFQSQAWTPYFSVNLNDLRQVRQVS